MSNAHLSQVKKLSNISAFDTNLLDNNYQFKVLPKKENMMLELEKEHCYNSISSEF